MLEEVVVVLAVVEERAKSTEGPSACTRGSQHRVRPKPPASAAPSACPPSQFGCPRAGEPEEQLPKAPDRRYGKPPPVNGPRRLPQVHKANRV